MVILDKIIIGLGAAAVTGLFAIGAKYMFLNPAESATAAVFEKLKKLEEEEERNSEES